jgi:hypothetical protein
MKLGRHILELEEGLPPLGRERGESNQGTEDGSKRSRALELIAYLI